MLIKPKMEERRNGYYAFGTKIVAKANACLNKSIFQEFWKGFCCSDSEIFFEEEKSFVFMVGEVSALEVPEKGYVMEISPKGISVAANDDKNLIYGFFAVLERIRRDCMDTEGDKLSVSCCRVEDKADVNVRMVHICVFPETTLSFMRKFFRLSAFLRYTHIVIEFWGSLKFDCLKELGWQDAFTKEEISPILEEARQLGLEFIPMFNHWGHATGSRVKTGKHVVLDQNLALASLFSNTGWEWNLNNPMVIGLHKNIRKELMELCGDGEYFHIGCDEAYSAETKADFEIVVDYVNNIETELKKYGRKTIMWGDMLLHTSALERKTENSYYLLSPSYEIQQFIVNKVSRSIIIGDWQYNAKQYPIETTEFFIKEGFEVLCCPWDLSAGNITVSSEMIKRNNLHGLLHTTWNDLGTIKGVWALAYSAALNWGETVFKNDPAYQGCEVASLLRKLDFPNGEYGNSGWEKKQI